MYATIGLVMAATMVGMYLPLFGPGTGHLGAVLAGGWTLSEVLSASVGRQRVVARLVAVAPLVTALGLALAAVTQRTDPGWLVIAAWVVALFTIGAGVGIA